MSWFLAPSLAVLRDQINAEFPNRNKASDGTIGDARHSAEVSDHNPDATGMVCAMDITHDPAHGVDINKLTDILYASRDHRIKYIIANRLITTPSGTGSGNYGGWVRYHGSDPHINHFHLSVIGGTLGRDTSPWKGLNTTSTPPAAPTSPAAPAGAPGYPLTGDQVFGTVDEPGWAKLTRSGDGRYDHEPIQTWVRMIQDRLNHYYTSPSPALTVDGVFGPATRRDVVLFQQLKGLPVDGMVGPRTWTALWS